MKQYIEINYQNKLLRGYHHQSNSDTVIVMLHGYTGNKTETKLQFKKLSATFETLNIDSLRVDYLGHGESDGEFSEMRFDDLLNQAETIIKKAQSLKYKHIYILGFSMGGLIALHQLKSPIEKAILISPAVDFRENIARDFDIYKPLANGNIDIGGLELHKDFSTSLSIVDTTKFAKTFKYPVCFVVGELDRAVSAVEVERVAKEFENSECHIFPKGDHLYSSLALQKDLINTISNFLNK